MKLPLDINSRGFSMPRSLEQFINQRAQELSGFFNRIIRCRVSVNYRGNSLKPLAVTIEITVPGRSLVINKDSAESLQMAVSSAFIAAQQQLQHYARQSKERIFDSLQDLGPAIISFLNPEMGYGHITTSSGRELYFDKHNVLQNGFRHLHPGMKVRFIENHEAPSPAASTLSPV